VHTKLQNKIVTESEARKISGQHIHLLFSMQTQSANKIKVKLAMMLQLLFLQLVDLSVQHSCCFKYLIQFGFFC